MRFTVPKFIEHEAKIVGPFTFRQFIVIGIAGAICFTLYFTLATTHFFLFLIISVVLMGGALVFAVVKVEGRSIPVILGNFFRFTLGPKIYIWKKTEAPIKVLKQEIKKEEKTDELPLKIAEKSQLKKIKTKLETRMK
jgi:hypothetical protein